jgi:uncharacterized protein
MFYINVMNSYRYVVAVCDRELLGKVFEEGKFQLDIKESFYKGKDGKEVNEEEAIRIMRKMVLEDATFNITGKRSVAAALKAGIIAEEGIGEIGGIPFALVLI